MKRCGPRALCAWRMRCSAALAGTAATSGPLPTGMSCLMWSRWASQLAMASQWVQWCVSLPSPCVIPLRLAAAVAHTEHGVPSLVVAHLRPERSSASSHKHAGQAVRRWLPCVLGPAGPQAAGSRGSSPVFSSMLCGRRCCHPSTLQTLRMAWTTSTRMGAAQLRAQQAQQCSGSCGSGKCSSMHTE